MLMNLLAVRTELGQAPLLLARTGQPSHEHTTEQSGDEDRQHAT